jgi:hypothetical protein
MKSTFFLIFLFCFSVSRGQSVLEQKHNPGSDLSLSPTHNLAIHPDHNSMINPRLNWNINPVKNLTINPEHETRINPKNNPSLDPTQNESINPMYMPSLSPKFLQWSGLYVFNKEDAFSGYITKYNQDLMIEFDREGNWNYFYIRTCKGTYNQFNLSAEWTGSYLCFDSMAGYNLFDREGNWTGIHIK